MRVCTTTRYIFPTTGIVEIRIRKVTCTGAYQPLKHLINYL